MNFTLQSLLAPALIIILVVVINAGLFYSLRSRNTHQQINLLRKAGQSARNPWKKEEEPIDALAEKISQLKAANKPAHAPDDKE